MDNIDFTFKKSRKMGDLISDFISLFRKIFKHYNKSIFIIALPFIAIFIIAVFFLLRYLTPLFYSSHLGFFQMFINIFIPGMVLFFLLYMLVTTFGIEYMLLLEKRGATNFSTSDVWENIQTRIPKYISFFFASIIIGIPLSIPLIIVGIIIALIPLVGAIAIGVIGGCVSLFFLCAMILYLEDRTTLWKSYNESWKIIKSKIFEYGLATYIFQMMSQIILAIITLVPGIVVFLIYFNSLNFNQDFFVTFEGKIIVALVSSLVVFFTIFSTIYNMSFMVLQYFSLIEKEYNETAIEDLEQIGKTTDEI